MSYYCQKCNKKHYRGKLYEDHKKFNQKKTNDERQLKLMKMTKLNRLLAFGTWEGKTVNLTKEDVEKIKFLREKIKSEIINVHY